MKVLIGCERFGVLRDAFARRGHDAWSCDLVDAPGPHIVGDIREVASRPGWDMLIAHPDCTYLTVANTYMKRGCSKYTAEEAVKLRDDAAAFFMECVGLCERIGRGAVENPIGVMSRLYRKPDQIVQPWQFGDDASKATCLWLTGLDPLKPTKIIRHPAWIRCECCDDFLCTLHPGQHVYDCPCPDIDTWARRGLDPYTAGGRYANQTPSGQNKLGPSADRAMMRAKTYTGIAEAMAEQWGKT